MSARLIIAALLPCALSFGQNQPVPSAETIAAMVPKAGKLGERELTLLAIAHRPELERLRGDVSVASAARRAAGDLANPELRLSYAQDNDDRIGEPYSERETVTISGTEAYDSTTASTTTLPPSTTVGESATESGTESTNRVRVIERRVTPGADRDIVEEKIYETTSTGSTSSSHRSKGGINSTQSTTKNEDRRLIGSSRKVIEHPNTSGRDNAWGLLLRFQLPHPWERRAKLQRAAAEISLAQADYYAEEDRIVRIVRATFQDLSLLEAKLTAQQKRKASYESYRDWLTDQKNPALGLELAAMRTKVHSTQTDLRETESKLNATRQDLAAYCGLSDPARIQAAMLTRHITSPAALDADYLTSIAVLYRSDVMSTQARLAVAQAQLAQAKSARIPFTSFLDLGYAQTNTLRRTGMSDELFIRVGVSIPLWDWLGINKQRQVPEAAQTSLQRQMTMQRTLIANEVAQATTRLKAALTQVGSYDSDLVALDKDLQAAQKETQLATENMNDLLKGKRIEHEFIDLREQMEISRYGAFAAYNEALMALEKALGIRLERALTVKP
jgi:outer membrane protein TolC